jgi:hypothetical protein
MRCSRRGRLSSQRSRSLVDNHVDMPDRRGGRGALAEPHPRFERLRVDAVQVKCCHSIEPALTEDRRQTGHAVAVALGRVQRSPVAGSPSRIPPLNVVDSAARSPEPKAPLSLRVSYSLGHDAHDSQVDDGPASPALAGGRHFTNSVSGVVEGLDGSDGVIEVRRGFPNDRPAS